MKEYIALMLTFLLMLSLAACVENPGEGSTAPSFSSTAGSTASTSQNGNQTDPSQSLTTVPTTSSSGVPTGGDEEPETAPNAMILHSDTQYEFQWIAIDDTKGMLTIATVLTASAEDMEGVGLSGSLVYKPEICTYEVSYTETDAGVYTASGAIVSVAASVEGESAEAFIQMMKQSLGDSKLDVMTGRVLDGEILTEKEDIEWLIWEYDVTVQVTFSVQDGKMVVAEFEKSYTSWGFMAPTKEIAHVKDGVVRRYEEYEQDELMKVTEYRENGVILKCTYYYEGKVSNEIHYDENGDEITQE